MKDVLHRTLGACDVFNKESRSPKLTKKICKVVDNTLQCKYLPFKKWGLKNSSLRSDGLDLHLVIALVFSIEL